MTESYLRNTPIETDRQKIESDLKKELTKAKRRNGLLTNQYDELNHRYKELEREYKAAKYRLDKYDEIMKFVAEDLSEKFGIMLRQEKPNCNCW